MGSARRPASLTGVGELNGEVDKNRELYDAAKEAGSLYGVIWRREGLKVPQKLPKRGCLWLNDGSCAHLRAERPNHVWSYDFVEDRNHDGRKFRMLCLIDEFTHETLAIRGKRKLNSTNVLETLGERLLREFQQQAARRAARRRDLLQPGEAQVLIEAWRRQYNGVRPHSSINYRPPAPESFVPRSGGIVP
jgi:putative transposase